MNVETWKGAKKDQLRENFLLGLVSTYFKSLWINKQGKKHLHMVEKLFKWWKRSSTKVNKIMQRMSNKILGKGR